jgi:thioredoxin 1
MLQHFSDDNFDTEVLKSDMPVLVDFFAEWCGPCKMMAPVIDKLSTELEGKIKIGKIDVDANSAVSMKYQIQSIPTLICFKNGEIVFKDSGFRGEDDLRKKLQDLIK